MRTCALYSDVLPTSSFLLYSAVTDISASSFFKTPFGTLCIPRQLVEYTVMDIEVVKDKDRSRFSGQGTISKKVSGWKEREMQLESALLLVHFPCFEHLGVKGTFGNPLSSTRLEFVPRHCAP